MYFAVSNYVQKFYGFQPYEVCVSKPKLLPKLMNNL